MLLNFLLPSRNGDFSTKNQSNTNTEVMVNNEEIHRICLQQVGRSKVSWQRWRIIVESYYNTWRNWILSFKTEPTSCRLIRAWIYTIHNQDDVTEIWLEYIDWSSRRSSQNYIWWQRRCRLDRKMKLVLTIYVQISPP